MKNKFYAYLVNGKSGVTDNWPDCQKLVSGKLGAKFKGFVKKEEAELWLSLGAKYEIKRLNFLKLSRQETLKQEEPIKVLKEFIQWIKKNSKDYPIFVSDNNGFDWMFVCWYLEHFIGKNPFGYNSMNLNSLYAGVTKQLNNNIKKIRKSLTHNALEDAKENAHILLTLIKSNNLKFPKGKS